MNIILASNFFGFKIIWLQIFLPSKFQGFKFSRLQIYLASNIISTGEWPISNVPCAEVVSGNPVPYGNPKQIMTDDVS